MPRPPVLVAAIVLACLLLAAAVNKRVGAASAGDGTLRSDDGDTVHMTPALRDAGLRFSPAVSATDRAWVLAAIAAARPEAQRLIGEVDGMVTIDTAGSGAMMGLTQPQPTGFRVWLNVSRLNGTRRIDRDTTVLHELGHVIDFALIPEGLDRRLDDGIPRGGQCIQQNGAIYGNCAPAEERIADTFAKWALGGSVSALGAGYAIANPPSLDVWGQPLVALAGSLAD
jgi:hypothetical protein